MKTQMENDVSLNYSMFMEEIQKDETRIRSRPPGP